MNKRTKKKLSKYLTIILNKNCTGKISLAGPKAEKNDCFVVYVDKDEKPYLLLKSIVSNTVECEKWNGKKYEDIVKYDITDIDTEKLDITHYHNTSIITFDSINDFRFHHITKLIYRKESIKRFLSKSFQKLYNRKNLVLPKRMNILKKIVEIFIFDPTSNFDELSILSTFHTSRWILHPKHEKYIREMKLYLDSLVLSNDLERNGLKYNLTAKAVVTINDYGENTRKYLVQLWLNIIITIATLLIAFSAIYNIFVN